MSLCSISVDLDEIPNYFAIHGVEPADVDRHAVYERAVARLLEWSESHRLPLTLFAVGSDLERDSARAVLLRAHQAGHEIANHSLDHHYDLTRRSRDEMRHQVAEANQRIAQITGTRPSGFRAPGYVTTQTLYDVLQEEGMRYSSSVFPCPWYYSAKALAIGLKQLRGHPSRSLVDDPRVLSAPTRPYRVGDPYYRRGSGMLELPIQVTPGLRLPFIGTSLMLAGPRGARWLTRRVRGAEFVNLELHGIDVLDAGDGLAGLAPHQPDLRVPTQRKLEILDQVVVTLKEAGYSFCALETAAERYRDHGDPAPRVEATRTHA